MMQKKVPPSKARIQGKRGGRGKATRNTASSTSNSKSSVAPTTLPAVAANAASDGAVDEVTRKLQAQLQLVAEPATVDDDEDDYAGDSPASGSCLICTDPIREFGLGSCNHRDICSICTLRRRQLCQDRGCMICKAQLDSLVFTSSVDKTFDQFDPHKMLSDKQLGLYFETEAQRIEVTRLVYEHKCPLCAVEQRTLQGLKKHVQTEHGQLYCDLCLESRKVFLCEQKLYADREALDRHMAHGDKEAGGDHIRPHIRCDFCSRWVYAADELVMHLRERHEKCQLCEIVGIRHQYFTNFTALERHYRQAHHVCDESDCLEQRLVFASALDLKAHQLKMHVDTRSMSKAEERKARAVQLQFTYSARRDERFERTDRTAQPPPPPQASSSLSSMADSSAAPQQSVQLQLQPPPPVAVEERNRALLQRLQALLPDQTQFSQFRQLSGDFRRGQLSAADYHAAFVALFGASATAELFPELIALLPDADKRAGLTLAFETARRKFGAPSQTPASNGSASGASSSSSSSASSSAPTAPAPVTLGPEAFPLLPGTTGARPSGPAITVAAPPMGARRGPLTVNDFPELPHSRNANARTPPLIEPPSDASSGAVEEEWPSMQRSGGKKKKGVVLMRFG